MVLHASYLVCNTCTAVGGGGGVCNTCTAVGGGGGLDHRTLGRGFESGTLVITQFTQFSLTNMQKMGLQITIKSTSPHFKFAKLVIKLIQKEANVREERQ